MEREDLINAKSQARRNRAKRVEVLEKSTLGTNTARAVYFAIEKSPVRYSESILAVGRNGFSFWSWEPWE